ncbi:MAG: hypothetical protein SPI77_07610 [Corynebacterium sp.]|nr:hypothetical protein [Corynebacterium sp.]
MSLMPLLFRKQHPQRPRLLNQRYGLVNPRSVYKLDWWFLTALVALALATPLWLRIVEAHHIEGSNAQLTGFTVTSIIMYTNY